MKNNKEKNIIQILLYLYIILLPFLNISKSLFGNIELFGISIVEIINLFCCGSMLVLILINKYKNNGKIDKNIILFSIILIIYLILHTFNVFTISGENDKKVNCILESYFILRSYVIPFILLYVIFNIDQNKNKIYKLLSMLAFIIATIILITNILKVGIITYDSYFEDDNIVYGSILDWKNDLTIYNYDHYSSKGLFVSGNQISLIMVSLLLISSLYLIKEEKWYLYISFIIKSISMIIISTKTAVFGLFIVLLFSLGMLILSKIFNKNSKPLFNIIFFSFLILISSLLFMISPISYRLGINQYEEPRSINTKNNAVNNLTTHSKNKIISKSEYICGFENTKKLMEINSDLTSTNMRKFIYNKLLYTNESTNYYCEFLEKNELASLIEKNEFTKKEKKILVDLINAYPSFFGIHYSYIEFMPVDEYFEFWIDIAKNKSDINADFRKIKRQMSSEYIDSNFNVIMGSLFGTTYISDFSSTENDVVTQYVWFGLIGLILFVFPFYALFIYFLISFIRYFDKNKIFEECFIMFSIFLILSICILSGHWFGDMFSMAILIFLYSLCHIFKNCHFKNKNINIFEKIKGENK